MRLQINDKEVLLPTSLSEITLGQRIDFYNQYGRELDEMAASILAMEEGPEKELEATQLMFEKMFRTFAFFTGTTPEALKESKFVDDVAHIYYSCLHVLFEDEDKLELRQEFTWNGEQWELHPPELHHGSKMTFGEFIDSKQLVKDMADLGAGNWELMLKLCAIYLRRKGEEYKEEFLFDGSERIELMRSLPMDIAMQVGFFLSSSMNGLINTLRSLRHPAQKEPASSA